MIPFIPSAILDNDDQTRFSKIANLQTGGWSPFRTDQTPESPSEACQHQNRRYSQAMDNTPNGFIREATNMKLSGVALVAAIGAWACAVNAQTPISLLSSSV